MERLSPVDYKPSFRWKKFEEEISEKKDSVPERVEKKTEGILEGNNNYDQQKSLSFAELLSAKMSSQKIKEKASDIFIRKTKDFGTYEMVSADYPMSHDDLIYLRVRSPGDDRNQNTSRISQVAAANKQSLLMKTIHPVVPLKKFKASIIEEMMMGIMEDALQHKRYDPDLCRFKAMVLSDQIKEKVKALYLPRYRVISTVFMGQLGKQSMRIGSRCTWDESTDNYAECTYRNSSIWAVAIVFGVYCE